MAVVGSAVAVSGCESVDFGTFPSRCDVSRQESRFVVCVVRFMKHTNKRAKCRAISSNPAKHTRGRGQDDSIRKSCSNVIQMWIRFIIRYINRCQQGSFEKRMRIVSVNKTKK